MNTKKTTTRKTPTPKSRPLSPQIAEPVTAKVHDLVGAAILILPKELRTLMGDGLLQSNAKELQGREVLVIVREPGVVAYLHLPIIAMEMEGNALNLAEGGTTLHAITGRWSKRLKGQIKRSDMVSVVKPVGKGGYHA